MKVSKYQLDLLAEQAMVQLLREPFRKLGSPAEIEKLKEQNFDIQSLLIQQLSFDPSTLIADIGGNLFKFVYRCSNVVYPRNDSYSAVLVLRPIRIKNLGLGFKAQNAFENNLMDKCYSIFIEYLGIGHLVLPTAEDENSASYQQ